MLARKVEDSRKVKGRAYTRHGQPRQLLSMFQGRTAQDNMQACEDKVKDCGLKLGGGVRVPLAGIYHLGFGLPIKEAMRRLRPTG